MSSDAKGTTTDLQAALNHGASLLKRSPTLAEQQALAILKQIPNEINAMQLLGAARRCQGRHDEALAVLQDVVASAPGFAHAQKELGLTLLKLGRGQEAIAALRKAVAIQPNLPKAWQALSDLLAAEGDEEGSNEARRQYLRAMASHPTLLRAANYLQAGDLKQVEQLCRAFLQEHPTNVSAINMLADVGIKFGRFEAAQKLLERCLKLAPDYHLARDNYALVLFERKQYKPALAELEKLLEIEPDNPDHHVFKAAVLAHIGEYPRAIEIYEWLLSRFPRQAKLHMSYGHALKTVGRQAEAIDAYRACIALRPSLGEAYWSLANLKTFRFEEQEIAAMRELVAGEQADSQDYCHMCFALGKALEDRQQYDEAFENYRNGNACQRKRVRWDADEHHQNCRALIECFDAEFFAVRAGQGCPSPDPIFIVGLPRTGSTLLEQILASHSQVEGTMELPDILAIAHRLSGKKSRKDESRYPDVLTELTAEQFAELGEEYLTRTRVHRSATPFFIDKMPNNFSHVGLIHLMLPNAKIIDARRHPLACCFSCFKQLFATGQDFSYDLVDIGRYYHDYAELMDHWERVLPGRVLRVQYEDVVADIEVQVRRVLEYCGLPFEAQCLKFYETQRAVGTASSEQVRRPIYTEDLEQWRNFRPHLDPLAAALGPSAILSIE